MVLATSGWISRAPPYSGYCCALNAFAYRAFTFYGRLSQNRSAGASRSLNAALNPMILSTMVWPLPVSLAATRGIDVSFFSCRYLDVSVRGVSPRHAILFTYRCLGFSKTGSPIRTSAARWLFAPPRGFSQLATSFFGSWCQGIHPLLFLACLLPFFAPVFSFQGTAIH